MANGTQTAGTSDTAGRGASKLALLAAFIAGAFAAWIVITVNTSEPDSVIMNTQPAQVSTVSKQSVPAPKTNVPKPNTKPNTP